MRSVPTALNNELLKEASYLANLVEMYLSSTVYFTNLDVDLVYGGHTYLSRGLSFSGAEYSITPQIDKISFEIDNVGLEFSAFLLSQETRGKRCDIKVAAMAGKDDILSNGNFETPGSGGFDLWTEGGAVTTDSGFASPASAKLSTGTGGDNAAVGQGLVLAPGQSYRISFRYKKSEAGITAHIYYYLYGPDDAYSFEAGTWGGGSSAYFLGTATQWAHDSVIINAHPTRSTNYVFGFQILGSSGANKHLWVDDISIVPIHAPPATVLAANTIFSGVLDSAKADHQRAVFDVYNPLIFWKRKLPRRIHQPSCPWPFKIAGSPCQYAGAETWCDQSYARCLTLANTNNFGGFRFLPDMQDKQIWWGRSPK